MAYSPRKKSKEKLESIFNLVKMKTKKNLWEFYNAVHLHQKVRVGLKLMSSATLLEIQKRRADEIQTNQRREITKIRLKTSETEKRKAIEKNQFFEKIRKLDKPVI